MTRYSASRGIRYSAPPGPDGDGTNAEADRNAEEPTTQSEEPTVEADAVDADAPADD